jgi:hypothetical protein
MRRACFFLFGGDCHDQLEVVGPACSRRRSLVLVLVLVVAVAIVWWLALTEPQCGSALRKMTITILTSAPVL